MSKLNFVSNELKQFAERVFCARKIIIISEKGISSIPISSKSQGMVVMLVLLILLWISYSTGKYVSYEHVISQKNREIWNTNIANEGLQYQMADLHQNLDELNKYFDNIKRLDQFSKKNGFAAQDTKKAKFDITKLLSHDKPEEETPQSQADGVQDILVNIRSKVIERIQNLEKIINMTGINLKKISENNTQLKNAMVNVPHLSVEKAGESGKNQGGPFYPADESKTRLFNQDEFEAEINYLTQLENIINEIPLSQPLRDYFVSSPFGVRSDPMRHSAAFHSGIDLAGEYKSKVYSSAPGVVVFAQPDGAYGQLIKISHGSGIETYYGHLFKILVREGQKVKRGQLIGLQGNSGRSTGTHLHYEVRLNNQPVNPANFLEAGKYVF